MSEGLTEIARVLKSTGQAWINFPLFLHGDPRCLRGELNDLLAEIPFNLFDEAVVQFVISEKFGPYKGWRRCGFPDFLVYAKS